MDVVRPKRSLAKGAWILAAILAGGGCSCDGTRSGRDAGPDADVPDDAQVPPDDGAVPEDAGTPPEDAGTPDAGAPTALYRVIHRQVAGAQTSESTNYRLVRTHGRGAGPASSTSYTRLGAQGGNPP